MNLENQESTLTNKNDIDPSIDPKVLIEQDDEDTGRIAAAETSDGSITIETNQDAGIMKTHKRDKELIEGLPVIGAEAENETRDKLEEADSLHGLPSGALNGAFSEAVRDMDGDKEQAIDALADKAGTEAMTEDISRRATEFAKDKFPLASQELIEKFSQKAVDKFKDELEKKSVQQQSKQEQDLQDLIDGLDTQDSTIEETLADLKEKPTADDSENIDTNNPKISGFSNF